MATKPNFYNTFCQKSIDAEFEKLKSESQEKIIQLQKHSDFLKTKISDMNNSCKTACEKVDKRIDDICTNYRQIGETIKDDINKIGEDENRKLIKLAEDVERMTSTMKEWCEYSDRILQHRCVIGAADKHGLELADAQTQTDYNISTHLNKPEVRLGVDVDGLKQLLGEVQTPVFGGKHLEQLSSEVPTEITFTRNFSLNQIAKIGKAYCINGPDIDGCSWGMGIKRSVSTLHIGLILKSKEDKTIRTVTAICDVKLLNINDENKSLVKQGIYTFTPGNYTCSPGVNIDWDKLRDVTNGYIDSNKIFTVQATVNVTDIKR